MLSMGIAEADGDASFLASIMPMRCRKTSSPPSQPVQEVPYGKQYRRRIPQEMDPARGQRANATDGHELDQTGHRRKGAHDDPKSHSEARAQNRSLVAQKARSVTSA